MKDLITLEEFRKYNNYYEEDTDDMCSSFIEAAEDMVIDYLGYDPNINDYVEEDIGIGGSKLYTRVTPIQGFSYITSKEQDIDFSDIAYNSKYIYSRSNSNVFKEGRSYLVAYSAGYKKIPQVIKLAVLRISSLMLAESNGNIGLSGKSNPDQSRTFISYANYDKYLKPLVNLRSVRIY